MDNNDICQSIYIEMPGAPVGKGRPRFTRDGRTYTPMKTKLYEDELRVRAKAALARVGGRLFEGPVKISICAHFPVPKSYPKARRNDCLMGVESPTKKPDMDNIIKTIDGLNGIIFRDDCQVVCISAVKVYSEVPRVIYVISKCNPAEEI